jgi:hypothetical protein
MHMLANRAFSWAPESARISENAVARFTAMADPPSSDSPPAPTRSRRWLSYETPPEGLPRILVGELLEDTGNFPARVERYRAAIAARQPHVFDFVGIPVLMQSAVHALLFQSVRVGWAMGVPVYVEHASPAVRSGLDYFESYAL